MRERIKVDSIIIGLKNGKFLFIEMNKNEDKIDLVKRSEVEFVQVKLDILIRYVHTFIYR